MTNNKTFQLYNLYFTFKSSENSLFLVILYILTYIIYYNILTYIKCNNLVVFEF